MLRPPASMGRVEASRPHLTGGSGGMRDGSPVMRPRVTSGGVNVGAPWITPEPTGAPRLSRERGAQPISLLTASSLCRGGSPAPASPSLMARHLAAGRAMLPAAFLHPQTRSMRQGSGGQCGAGPSGSRPGWLFARLEQSGLRGDACRSGRRVRYLRQSGFRNKGHGSPLRRSLPRLRPHSGTALRSMQCNARPRERQFEPPQKRSGLS